MFHRGRNLSLIMNVPPSHLRRQNSQLRRMRGRDVIGVNRAGVSYLESNLISEVICPLLQRLIGQTFSISTPPPLLTRSRGEYLSKALLES